MDRIDNGTVPGTSTSSVARLSGGGAFVTFKNAEQKYLNFDGTSNYITITNLVSPCVLHPDSTSCPHGITMSYVFKKTGPVTVNNEMVIDTIMGGGNKAAGYRIYFSMEKISILLKASFRTYQLSSGYNRQQWNHFAFTYSSTDGLTAYMNGNRT